MFVARVFVESRNTCVGIIFPRDVIVASRSCFVGRSALENDRFALGIFHSRRSSGKHSAVDCANRYRQDHAGDPCEILCIRCVGSDLEGMVASDSCPFVLRGCRLVDSYDCSITTIEVDAESIGQIQDVQ